MAHRTAHHHPNSRRGATVLAAALSVLMISGNALALPGDTVQFSVGETLTADDNVFRRPIAEKDTRSTTSAGVSVDALISRQRIQASLNVNDERYRKFKSLNFTGWDARLAWLWQVGNDWSGQLGYTDSKTFSSFTNFATTTADPLKTRRLFGSAAWLLTPSWELRGELARQEQRNDSAARRENDIDLNSGELGLNYISAAGNRLGISARQEDGSFVTAQQLGGLSITNDYRQRSLGIVADWSITAKSHLNARLDRVRREYEQFGQRDFSDTTARLAYDWKVTEKLALTALARREISADEDIQTSFVVVRGIGLRPSFALTEKITLSAVADHSRRTYRGDPGLVLGTTAAQREDRVRRGSLAVSYRPLSALTLGLSGDRETRSSNIAGGDYTANVLRLFGRFTF